MREMFWSRASRLAALGLMLSGFVLSIWGQVTEASLNAMPQRVFLILEKRTADQDYFAERIAGAKALQSAGFLLLLAGPPIWLIDRYVTVKRRIKLSRSQRNRGSRIYGS